MGLPVGGLGFTRLVMLMLVARLARQTSAGLSSLPVNLQEDINRLADGDTAEFKDPFLVGNTVRTRELLEVLTEVLPPHRPDNVRLSQSTCEVLADVAEELKIRLHTPLNDAQGESYPDTVTLDGDLAEQWRQLCLENKVGDAQATPSCSAKAMDALFTPALKTVVDVTPRFEGFRSLPRSTVKRSYGGKLLERTSSLVSELSVTSRSSCWATA